VQHRCLVGECLLDHLAQLTGSLHCLTHVNDMFVTLHQTTKNLTITYPRARKHTTVLRVFFQGPPGWASARINLLDFYGAKEDNTGIYNDHPVGHHSIRTKQQPTSAIPSIFMPDAFLLQHSHFILAWDRHHICWLAYPVDGYEPYNNLTWIL